MEITETAQHTVRYDTTTPVTAKALADSLLGIETLARVGVGALIKELHPELDSVRFQVLVAGIEIGSYKENLLFRMVFGKGKAAEQKLDRFRASLGLNHMSTKHLAAGGLILVVLYLAYDYMKSKPSGAAQDNSIHIENSFVVLGKEMGIGSTSEEVLERTIKALARNKERLKKGASKVVHPNGEMETGTLSVEGLESVKLGPEILKHIPVQYEAPEKNNPEEDYDDVEMVIRALDLDSAKSGWAGVVPSISTKRLPIQIGKDVDLSKVPTGRPVKVDVTAVLKVKKNGDEVVTSYVLRKVYSEY